MTHIYHVMRATALAATLLCLAAAARAQPAAPVTNCTDVQVGSAQSYDCINAQLGTLARGTQRYSSDANAPVNSSSPSNVVGTFNQSATANRLGQNFGKSATPTAPLTRRRQLSAHRASGHDERRLPRPGTQFA